MSGRKQAGQKSWGTTLSCAVTGLSKTSGGQTHRGWVMGDALLRSVLHVLLGPERAARPIREMLQ
jgi:hypothetical protein